MEGRSMHAGGSRRQRVLCRDFLHGLGCCSIRHGERGKWWGDEPGQQLGHKRCFMPRSLDLQFLEIGRSSRALRKIMSASLVENLRE